MKNFITIILTLFITVAFVSNSIAQCGTSEEAVQINIDNAGFENWDTEGSYEDPSPDGNGGGGFWDTANKVIDLYSDATPTATKSTDAHSGDYSIKLRTESVNVPIIGELLTAASVFTGKFEPNPLDPLNSAQFGKPFTERPNYMRVWYQFEPVEGDSAEVYCYLEKGTDNETRIGTAYTKIYDATTGWTELVLPFEYESNEAPESITIVFAASSEGDNFEGQVGTTLYIDDVELFYCFTTSNEDLLSEGFTSKVYPNPSLGENIKFEFSKESDAVLNIFSVDGKQVFSTNLNGDNYELDITEWNNGFYQYVINDKDSKEAISRGSFAVQ